MKEIFRKHLGVEALTTIGFSAIVVFLTWSIKGISADFTDLLFAGLVSLLPGILFGAVAGLLIEFYEKLAESKRIFTLADVIWGTEGEVKYVLNNCSDKHMQFVKTLILRSTQENINVIPEVSLPAFYDILVEALECCQRWEGIHQGSITLLGKITEEGISPEARQTQPDGSQLSNEEYKDASRYYFTTLCQAVISRKVRATRIIILPDEFRSELQNPEIMESFWNATGSTVRSYLIYQSDIEKKLQGTKVFLQDAALHDKELFLQYNQAHEIARFESWKSKSVPSEPRYCRASYDLVRFLFADLDRQLNKRTARYAYQELTKDYIQKSIGRRLSGPDSLGWIGTFRRFLAHNIHLLGKPNSIR